MSCVDLHRVDFAKYFRTGLYTDFRVEDPWVKACWCTVVHLRYTFLDFGMCHEIDKTFWVRRDVVDGHYWVKDKERDSCVQNVEDALALFGWLWVCVDCSDDLWDVLFDHYYEFVDKVYADFVGINGENGFL